MQNAKLDPKNDGIDHINIYSKGKTALGLFLSNFAHSPITTPDGRFSSIEGYWYWLGTDHKDRDKLRLLHGFEAKKAGRELKSADWNDEPQFKEKIKKAIYAKIFSNIDMAIQLKKSELPFTHYYDYKGKVVVPEDGAWIIQFIEELRVRLKSYSGLIYQPGDLFEAPVGATLAHACNAHGSWGAGIALEFKRRFPQSYAIQKQVCEQRGVHLLGEALVNEENGYRVASLFTSDGYGRHLSCQERILKNTGKAIAKLLNDPLVTEIWMPKINSRLFATPWERTEIVLLGILLLRPDKRIVVRLGNP